MSRLAHPGAFHIAAGPLPIPDRASQGTRPWSVQGPVRQRRIACLIVFMGLQTRRAGGYFATLRSALAASCHPAALRLDDAGRADGMPDESATSRAAWRTALPDQRCPVVNSSARSFRACHDESGSGRPCLRPSQASATDGRTFFSRASSAAIQSRSAASCFFLFAINGASVSVFSQPLNTLSVLSS